MATGRIHIDFTGKKAKPVIDDVFAHAVNGIMAGGNPEWLAERPLARLEEAGYRVITARRLEELMAAAATSAEVPCQYHAPIIVTCVRNGEKVPSHCGCGPMPAEEMARELGQLRAFARRMING